MPSDQDPEGPEPFELPELDTSAVPQPPKGYPPPAAPVTDPTMPWAEQKAPVSAAEWKSARTKGFTIDLPSGQTVMVRRTFDMVRKLRAGEIPNPLAGHILRMIERNEAIVRTDEMTEEGVGQMLTMFDETCAAMLITPKMVVRPLDAAWDWAPPGDSISSEDMDLEDKVFLFMVAQGGTADLATFRQQSADLMASASDGDGVQPAAQ